MSLYYFNANTPILAHFFTEKKFFFLTECKKYVVWTLFFDAIQLSIISNCVHKAIISLRDITKAFVFFCKKSFFCDYFFIFYNESRDMLSGKHSNEQIIVPFRIFLARIKRDATRRN